ncbi:MAG: hypothetical protein G01um10147_1006 [Microgenomates group bacterium Gr01-1014_7]|nr:MAG: hypothetical protein G01um10147_1006 [Microgenomates group bacterium Gr01-1014_7]
MQSIDSLDIILKMKDLVTEKCIPWDKAQTEERLHKLDDSLIDLRRVLYRYAPDHIHLSSGGLPLYIDLIGRMRDAFLPAIVGMDDWYKSILESYLRKNGLPGLVDYNDIYEPAGKALLKPGKILRFREVDFVCPAKSFPFNRPFTLDINTTSKVDPIVNTVKRQNLD